MNKEALFKAILITVCLIAMTIIISLCHEYYGKAGTLISILSSSAIILWYFEYKINKDNPKEDEIKDAIISGYSKCSIEKLKRKNEYLMNNAGKIALFHVLSYTAVIVSIILLPQSILLYFFIGVGYIIYLIEKIKHEI
jgi:hypothetical protein